MTAQLRDAARVRFCDVLLQVPSDAPTLCEAWDAHHLAAHVWTLSYDPAAWPGMLTRPLSAYTTRRLERTVAREPYPALVARLRRMRGFACMPLDVLEGHRHALGEYVVHTEDVLRANGTASAAPGPELAEALWLRLKTASRQLHRRRRSGLLLRCTGPVRDAYVVRPGPGTAVTGDVLELLLWVYGRHDAASVSLAAADG